MTFDDGGTILGTASLSIVDNQATATLTTSTLAPGIRSITAVYGGDQSNQGSTSAPVNFVVGSLAQNVTQTAVAATSGTLSADQSVTLTATVNISVPANAITEGDTPTGTVTFLDGATTLGTAPVTTSGGVTSATLATTALGNGAHYVAAFYDGDSKNQASMPHR